MTYFRRLLISIDQCWNVILGGNEDETISSAVGRKAVAGKRWAIVAEYLINALFNDPYVPAEGRPGHCRANIEHDEVGANCGS